MTDTIFDFNGSKNAGWSQPLPLTENSSSHIPESMRRNRLPDWPRASEPELVRHYTKLSQKNFGIDTGFCLLYTSPSPRDISGSRMPSSA